MTRSMPRLPRRRTSLPSALPSPLVLLLAATAALAPAGPPPAAASQTAAAPAAAATRVAAQAQQPRRAGTVIVPDHFLRRWDPVTVFFDHDAGPANGGPQDDPGPWVKVTPRH